MFRRKEKKENKLEPGDINSPFNKMPDELLLHLLTFLNPKERKLNAARVCHRFNDLCKDETFEVENEVARIQATQDANDRRANRENSLKTTQIELLSIIDSLKNLDAKSELHVFVTGLNAQEVLNLRNANNPNDHYNTSLNMRRVIVDKKILCLYSPQAKPTKNIHAIIFSIDTKTNIDSQLATLNDLAQKHLASAIFIVSKTPIQCPYLQITLTKEDNLQTLYTMMVSAANKQIELYQQQIERLCSVNLDEPLTKPKSRCTIS